MQVLENTLNEISSYIWGPVMLTLLLGIGIYLTIGLKFFTFRNLLTAMMMLWRGRKSDKAGDITPFQALMTAYLGIPLILARLRLTLMPLGLRLYLRTSFL